MKFRFLILLSVSLIIILSCKKDTITESYLRGGNSIINTADGNLLIAGYNVSSGNGFDGYLVKVTKSGEQIWAKYFGNTGTDAFYNVINATGGGYVATGFQEIPGYDQPNIYIVKTDDQGQQLWQYVGDSTKRTRGFGVAETPDNGFIACGFVQDAVNSDRDIYLVKVNSLGSKVWEKRYGSRYSGSYTGIYDEAYSIVKASDSGYFITGSLKGNIDCCGNSFLMKISANGDSLWTKSYSEALGYSIAQTNDGNIIISGSSNISGQNAYLLKTDPAGAVIWEKFYAPTGYDYGTAIVQTLDGGYALAGYASTSASANPDVSLYKINSNGSLVWAKKFGGSNVDQGFGIAGNPDGGFCITGLSNTGGSYIFLDRTDSTGIELWQKNLK